MAKPAAAAMLSTLLQTCVAFSRSATAISALAPRHSHASASLSKVRYVEPPHPATIDAGILKRECDLKHTRGSGAGGQHRNKVSTAVVLTHRPTTIVGAASEARSQQANLSRATFRLRVALALRLRCEVDLGAPPSALWAERARSGRLAVNEGHEAFPALLAEALDRIWVAGDVRPAAEALGLSTSQLVKLLRKEPESLGLTNQLRAQSGLPPLN